MCENGKQVADKVGKTSHFSYPTCFLRLPSQHVGNKALNQGVCGGGTGIREGEGVVGRY